MTDNPAQDICDNIAEAVTNGKAKAEAKAKADRIREAMECPEVQSLIVAAEGAVWKLADVNKSGTNPGAGNHAAFLRTAIQPFKENPRNKTGTREEEQSLADMDHDNQIEFIKEQPSDQSK